MADADNLISTLNALAVKLRSVGNAQKFSDSWGSAFAPLNKDDLAEVAASLALKLEAIQWGNADASRETFFNALAEKVAYATAHSAPNVFSNNGTYLAILALLFSVEMEVASRTENSELRGAILLPATLIRDVRTAKRQLESATSGIENLESKVTAIQDAYNAALNLPTTKQELEDAIKDVTVARKEAQQAEFEAKGSAKAADDQHKHLESISKEADSVLAKLNAAYRAATSQGLAQAFKKKEESLNQSMLLWIVGLLASLTAAGIIGNERFPLIMRAISGRPDWGIVLVNVTLAALSLAAPVWFGWVSTKQIGQRFRLSEDYAYKAALATAYEGYRNEAAQLNKELEAQLFAIALGRLDEIPLRLVDQDIPGSPMHELFKSAEFKQAVDQVPGFLDRIIAVLKRHGNNVPKPETDAAK